MKCPHCDEEMFAVSNRTDARVVCCPECGREFKVPTPPQRAAADARGGAGVDDVALRAGLAARSRAFACASPVAPRVGETRRAREDLFNWF